MKNLSLILTAALISFNAYATPEDDTVLKAYSTAPEYQNEQPLDKLSDTLNQLKLTQKQPKAVNTDPSKATAIFGTYQLTYKIVSTYTDKLVLDSTYTSPTTGDIMASGTIYPNNGSTGHYIICSYTNVFASINADYLCVDSATIRSSYVLRFNASNVSGYYAIGNDANLVVTTLLNKYYPIFGTKAVPSQPNPTPAPANEDEYNPATGDLSLTKVKVGSNYYNAILNTKDGNTFTLKSATKN